MALQTSPDSPAALRTISSAVGDWVNRLGAVWVEAEVTELRRRQGTCFLTLKDRMANVVASATCHVAVLDAVPAPVGPGAHVVVQAKPAYYVPRGSFALEIREIRLQGEGILAARLEQLKQALAAEGLFAAERKRALPFLPRGIGLITARDSAAERDVLENARRRWPGVRFLIRHTTMQGPDSARDVIHSLGVLDADDTVDVIVISRGGGSLEDLLPFSDEGLVRAVTAATTPVVSAIGHEQDVPLLDLVADVRASTPTDAAKIVVPDVGDELRGLAHARDRMRRTIRGLVDRERHALDQIRSRPVLWAPTTLIDAERATVAEQRDRARRSVRDRLARANDEIGHHLARVRALSPLATLERGYSVTQLPDGTVVTRLEQAPPGTVLTVKLTDGALTVRTVEEETS